MTFGRSDAFFGTSLLITGFIADKSGPIPPRHDFAPTRAPELQKRHLGHGFAHFRAGGRGKAIIPAVVRADYDENRLTL